MKELILPLIILFSPPGLLFSENAEVGPNRFAQADKAFLNRADKNSALEALSLYRDIHKKAPRDPQAAWRLSMACYFAGFNLLIDEEEKKKIFAEGRDAGLVAVKYAPASAEAHFWTAINMALYGQAVGVVKMLFTLNAVCNHLEASLKINPGYAYGGAYRVLGKINETLPEVLGGNKRLAREYYEKAIEKAPDEPLNYLFLAKFVLTEHKDKETSLDLAYKGLAVNNLESYRFESMHAQQELRNIVTVCSEKK